MAEPIRVNLSIIYGRMRKIIDLGREHAMHNEQGALRNATVCTKILDRILDLRHNEVYSRILEAEGLTLFDLIKRALFDYAAKGGYIKKNRR